MDERKLKEGEWYLLFNTAQNSASGCSYLGGCQSGNVQETKAQLDTILISGVMKSMPKCSLKYALAESKDHHLALEPNTGIILHDFNIWRKMKWCRLSYTNIAKIELEALNMAVKLEEKPELDHELGLYERRPLCWWIKQRTRA